MTNGWGDYLTTREADQAAYDRLPPRLRWAVAYAVGPYAGQPILKAYRAGVNEDRLIAAIRRQDLEGTITAYGPTHPEAMHV